MGKPLDARVVLERLGLVAGAILQQPEVQVGRREVILRIDRALVQSDRLVPGAVLGTDDREVVEGRRVRGVRLDRGPAADPWPA